MKRPEYSVIFKYGVQNSTPGLQNPLGAESKCSSQARVRTENGRWLRLAWSNLDCVWGWREKIKKKTWSAKETDIIVDQFILRKDTINSMLSATVTKDKKKSCLEQHRGNITCGVHRWGKKRCGPHQEEVEQLNEGNEGKISPVVALSIG
ncbi:hypothetical protein OUZ56_003671 [Daphnia magna]|uniref:Uncharacterized protein n=1 Tax=Daphnia magna TaxID=35525 RepID=A0ABR0A9G3_9CRUS|nr:hypothetical protein OUZ56_003671 [Daphnia magna]